jgi:hypothetical protein
VPDGYEQRHRRITTALGLDANRSGLYLDLVLESLTEAARRELQTMNPRTYEYQSEFARRYFGQGQQQGRLAIVERLLTARFGALPPEIRERLAAATSAELDAIGDRLLNATTLEEAVGR